MSPEAKAIAVSNIKSEYENLRDGKYIDEDGTLNDSISGSYFFAKVAGMNQMAVALGILTYQEILQIMEETIPSSTDSNLNKIPD